MPAWASDFLAEVTAAIAAKPAIIALLRSIMNNPGFWFGRTKHIATRALLPLNKPLWANRLL
jgi:hypothetical protein